MSETIINSTVPPSVKKYRNVVIKNSEVGINCSIGDDTLVMDSSIENFVELNRRNNIFGSRIGAFTYTAENTHIAYATIGRFCSVSWNCSIGGKEHDYSMVTTHPLARFNNMFKREKSVKNLIEKQCIIGNDVWIASNAVVLRDVRVGNGAVIGAGAIITKDIEPYSIVVGNPGMCIKKRFEDKIVQALEEIQWWNWPIEIIDRYKQLIYSSKINSSIIEKLRDIKEKIKE